MNPTAHTLPGFGPVPVGEIRGTRPPVARPVPPTATGLELRYPTRLNAMALDPGKIVASQGGDGGGTGFPAGELLLACDLFRTVRVELLSDSEEVTVAPDSARPVLARHAALITRSLLGTRQGLRVRVDEAPLPPHIGMGSSSATIAAVSAAINELYGRPLPARQLIKFLVDNHGEEIDGTTDRLIPVQCIGGSAAAGLMKGSAQVVAGNATPTLAAEIPEGYTVLLAVPPGLKRWDGAESLREEARHFDKFRDTGERYAREIAYRLVHHAWPALLDGDVREFGRLIFDYRFRMGSIENCSFSHPRLLEFAGAVEPLFPEGVVDVLGLSSVGPTFFALTRDAAAASERLRSAGLDVLTARPWSEGYTVVRTW
ncbi:GHMP family kinase ATP-binding protein [Streptomyces sp. URMC 123]|uniref:GHMP family kinase ATP-binding protein n=1 Tax=Streptomyces sp. URMC 123 TaxID=3423403 RepID=UPI003F1A4E61